MDQANFINVSPADFIDEEQWKDDKDFPNCSVCSVKFSFMKRRHHCRCCGDIVCTKCAPEKGVSEAGFVRVCAKCTDRVKERRSKEKAERKKETDRIETARQRRAKGLPDNVVRSSVKQKSSETANQLDAQYAAKQQMARISMLNINKEPEKEEELKIEPLPENWRETKFIFELCDTVDWKADENCNNCTKCDSLFDQMNRKHHCRGCGNIYCDPCAPFVGVPSFKQHERDRLDAAERLCEACCAIVVAKGKRHIAIAKDKKTRVDAIKAEKLSNFQENQ